MVDALTYVHARELFHRDLKPESFMVDNNGNPFPYIGFLIDSNKEFLKASLCFFTLHVEMRE